MNCETIKYSYDKGTKERPLLFSSPQHKRSASSRAAKKEFTTGRTETTEKNYFCPGERGFWTNLFRPGSCLWRAPCLQWQAEGDEQ